MTSKISSDTTSAAATSAQRASLDAERRASTPHQARDARPGAFSALLARDERHELQELSAQDRRLHARDARDSLEQRGLDDAEARRLDLHERSSDSRLEALEVDRDVRDEFVQDLDSYGDFDGEEGPLEGADRGDEPGGDAAGDPALPPPIDETARPPEPANEPLVPSPRADVAAISKLATKLVEACMLGTDQRARKVLLLDIQLPGAKGSVRVRLNRDADGVNVRLRAEDADTRALLTRHQGDLREQGARVGVVFKQIEIV